MVDRRGPAQRTTVIVYAREIAVAGVIRAENAVKKADARCPVEHRLGSRTFIMRLRLPDDHLIFGVNDLILTFLPCQEGIDRRLRILLA